MKKPTEPKKKLTLDALADLRKTSENVSKLLGDRLRIYVETLRPLFDPQCLLGRYAGGREEVAGASKALAAVKEAYQTLCGQPFLLPRDLDEEWLEQVGNQVVLYPWEYDHDAQSGKDSKTITITSPLCWVLAYKSPYSPSDMQRVMRGKGERRREHVRQFVVNAIVLDVLLARTPGIVKLFDGLRFRAAVVKLPETGDLPIVKISGCVPSFLPPDDLLLTAVGFSGVASFTELVETEALADMPDPLKMEIEKAAK